MADNGAVRSVKSAGRALGDTAAGVGDAVTKTAARGREEAEDIWAEAKSVADKGSLPGSRRDAAVFAGLTATAAVGVVELPVAAALGAGYAIVRRATGNGSTQRGSRSNSKK